MGRRGPAPTPTAIRFLEGQRASRINTFEPVPEQTGPKPLPTFTAEQRDLWDRVVERLTEYSLAYKADEAQLIDYVFAEWLSQECVRRLNATGLLVRGANGEPKPNPLLRVQHRADETALRIGRQFGMTPSSRQRLLPKREPLPTW